MIFRRDRMIALRMRRQGLLERLGEEDYEELYRDTQPGQNVYWHGFGQPPVLSFRANFDELAYNAERQKKHLLAKGRFQGGNLGWIVSEDMELFACLCCKPLSAMSPEQERILWLIEHEGPLTIQQLKEETGMLVKKITPILHRLQEAFLIYEDQAEGEWDRGFYRFGEFFPEVDITRYARDRALQLVLPRFAYRMVWFDAAMVRSFYKLPLKEIKTAIAGLMADGILISGRLDSGEDGYLLKEDAGVLSQSAEDDGIKTEGTLFAMHRNDILIKTQEHLLKGKYTRPGCEVLEYLLIAGEVHGAVLGRFKFGPDLIEDIIVDEDFCCRRKEILAEVQKMHGDSMIQRFMGEEL